MNVEISLLALAVVNLLICLWVGRNFAPPAPVTDDMTWLQPRADAVVAACQAAEENARAAWQRGDNDSRRFWMRVQEVCADEMRDIAPAMKAVQP
jgi:hypothetical protein